MGRMRNFPLTMNSSNVYASIYTHSVSWGVYYIKTISISFTTNHYHIYQRRWQGTTSMPCTHSLPQIRIWVYDCMRLYVCVSYKFVVIEFIEVYLHVVMYLCLCLAAYICLIIVLTNTQTHIYIHTINVLLLHTVVPYESLYLYILTYIGKLIYVSQHLRLTL